MSDRKEKLLAAARERLLGKESDEHDDQEGESGRQVMYRGQVVRQSRSSTADGASSMAEIQVALAQLKELYHEGLISRTEAEQKKAELLEGLDP